MKILVVKRGRVGGVWVCGEEVSRKMVQILFKTPDASFEITREVRPTILSGNKQFHWAALYQKQMGEETTQNRQTLNESSPFHFAYLWILSFKDSF